MKNFRELYHHKWFPRIFFKKHDGGKESGVTGYMLIEWKPVFSIGLLHFKEGSREAYHSHAFNAVTWWLKGYVVEQVLPNIPDCVLKNQDLEIHEKEFVPSLKPKLTQRSCVHKVFAYVSSWALTFRGPWKDTWYEISKNGKITLTHGRKVVQ